MKVPHVTVLTAVHNGAAYLQETIGNILEQDFTDFEYVIVDDASTDETPALVERAARRDSRIRLLRRSVTGGPYAAANTGLAQSRGRYIVRTDADDLSPRHRIRTQLAYLEAHPEVRACVSWWQAFNEKGPIEGSVVKLPQSQPVFCWSLALRAPSIHSTACLEREALLEIGGYRELPLSQDYRLWCELTRRRWLGVVPEVLSYVRFHAGRATNRRAALQRSLAMDVLSDHIFALGGERWEHEELAALWAAVYCLPYSVSRGMNMLDRWESLWRADATLTAAERRELAGMAAFRRWKFLRSNLRRHPVQTLAGAVLLGIAQPFSVTQLRAAVRTS
jgi:glycosyltransferase involved in cell wall biosynthesis